MAKRLSHVLDDDLDGGPAAETVKFDLDGTAYTIDLSQANAAVFREALAPFKPDLLFQDFSKPQEFTARLKAEGVD